MMKPTANPAFDRAGQAAVAAAEPPQALFATELVLRAQGSGRDRLGMRLALLDVDGVLTDGRLFIGEAGELFKAFHVLDGHGLKLLQHAGITPVIITGRDSPGLRRRLADLGLTQVHYGVVDKLAVAQQVLADAGLDWPDVAAIGDDWPDLPLLARAGLACAPPNAHAEVLRRVHHITRAPGGQGAAREFCDLLLMGSGGYAALLEAHAQTLDSR
jgi:3-deoxy-D-manno-octulosonate 8-phosphate phosphatase (KDO 8-P phosphatase)